MYIIRDKRTLEILFTDPERKSGRVDAAKLFPDFDAASMEVGWTSEEELPLHFDILENGKIEPHTDRQLVEAGVLTLAPEQKLQGNNIVDKTLEEQVAENLIQLAPNQKVEDGEIVEKTIEDKVAEGSLVLADFEKIEDGEIVMKSLEEQVDEGMLEIDEPFRYIAKGEIKKRSLRDVVNKDLLTTLEQCERAKELLAKEIQEAIGEKYSMADELNIVKNYLYWLEDDKPEGDHRPDRFREMKAHTEKVKRSWSNVKQKIQEKLDSLS